MITSSRDSGYRVGARTQALRARVAPAFVWGVWAVMLLVVLLCIAAYGPSIPRAEDWFLVPPLTGNEPSLVKWLWEQNSEHRVPVPKLAYLALLKVAGGDFRAGMVFNTLAMAGLALAMIRVARALRGRTTCTDAFFPVALLHIGHWDNLVWSWQIQFVLSTFLAATLLLIIITQGARLTPGGAAAAGACLILLPLCGANGLVLVPALALWFGYAGLLRWRRPEGPGDQTTGLLLLAPAALAIILTGVYFVGFERASGYPPSPGLGATLRTGARFLAMAFGPAAGVSWPASVLATLGILLASSAVLLAAAWRSQGGERQRALGLFLFVGALVMLALATGWGRAGRAASVGMSRRYALLAVPVLCCIYFVWELYGRPRWRALVQAGLLLLVVVLIPENTVRGFAARDWVQAGMDAVQRDITAGMPRALLAERHQQFLLHWDRERLAAGMRMLRQARLGPFARLSEEDVREIVVPAAPGAPGPGEDLQPHRASPPLAFALEAPRRVYAIRLRFPEGTLPVAPGPAQVQVAWQGRERGTVTESRPITPPDQAPDAAYRTATVWVNDVIDRFRIQAEDPIALRGAQVLAVVPANP